MAKKETAEQKLLKMIETSSDGGGEPAASVKTKEKAFKKVSTLSLVKSVNKFLLVGLIVAAVLLANEIRVGMSLLSKSIHFSIDQKAVSRVIDERTLMPTVQDIAFYLASVNQRNIFLPFEEEKKQLVVDVSEDNRRIVRKTAKFRLVGISWLDTVDSASVMIEDVEKDVTHFMRKGEKIDDVKIKTIYADSALLGYENEELMIRYDKSQM